jgi:precorrin-3B synthase
MNARGRRGACPGLSAPMPTGDGLLVRLMPTEPIAPAAFARFCAAARQHGNGTIEISARGSLQVRGLTPRSAPMFAAAVADLEIIAQEGVQVITGPLFDEAGPHLGIAGVTLELRRAPEHAQLVLSPKVSVVVDGDGGLHLDAVPADIRLRATGPAQQPRFCIGLGGNGTTAAWLGSIAPGDAVEVVLGLLRILAAHGPTARAADILRSNDVVAFHSVLDPAIAPAAPPPRRTPAEMVGLHPLRDGTSAVGIGLAFGHVHADPLAEITRLAAAHGARSVRPAPDRALLLIGVAAPDAIELTAAADQLGFVVRAGDPRRRIAACPGAPACTFGLIAARAIATSLAPALAAHLPSGPGVAVHISGCAKGCAHPAPAALTVVGTARGCAIIRDGSASATPAHHVDPAHLAAEIARLATPASEAAHG